MASPHNRRPAAGQADREPARLSGEQWNRIADKSLEIARDLGLNLVRICGNYARFGTNQGSLKVWFKGPHKGTWWDVSEKGDIIALIRRETGRGFADAVEFALEERIQDPVVVKHKRKARSEQDYDRTAFARQQWGEAKSVIGTQAETYLTVHRGSRAEVVHALDHAGRIRFHPAHKFKPSDKWTAPALLVAATDLAGIVHGFQAIRLKADGSKRDGNAKFSAGDLSKNNAVGWLSGGVDDIISGEGPEDAITLYEARPEAMVGAAFGGLKRLIDALPPAPRRVILAAQNDAPDSDAAKGFKETCEALTAAGYEVWIARPPAGIKDANDLLRADGIDAVRTMLDAAQPFIPPSRPKPSLPAYYPGPTETAENALNRQMQAITGFLTSEIRMCEARHEVGQRVLAEISLNPDMTPAQKGAVTRKAKKIVAAERGLHCIMKGDRLLVTGSQGTGKTQTVLEFLAQLEKVTSILRELASLSLPWIRIVMTVPMLDKADEALVAYNKLAGLGSLPARVIRGRSAPIFKGSDERMCPRHEVVNKLAASGVEIRKKICATCPLRDGCGTRRQEADLEAMNGGIFFMAREYAFLPNPVTGVHMMIGDESFATVAPSSPVSFSPEKIMDLGNWKQVGLSRALSIMGVLNSVYRCITQHPTRILAALREADISRKNLKDAARYLDDVRESTLNDAVDGAMSDAEISRILAEIQNHEVAPIARMLRQLATEMKTTRSQTHTVVLREFKDEETQVVENRVVVFHLNKLKLANDVPVLLIDGTGNPWINRKIFGQDLRHVHIPVERSAKVVGVVGRDFSRQSITGLNAKNKELSHRHTSEAKKLRANLAILASRLKGSVFVCATMRAEAALAAEMDGIDVLTGHFCAVRGFNLWELCQSALIIGREEVHPHALEDLTRPYLADEEESMLEVGNYVTQTRGRRMRDGSVEYVECLVHPDLRCEAIHEQIREADIVQSADRVRPIFNKRDIYLMNDLVVDVTYDINMSFPDLLAGGTKQQRAFERTGRSVWLHGPGELSRCFNDLWPTKDHAKKDLRAKSIGGEDSLIVFLLLANLPPLCVTYQRPGKGQQPMTAWVSRDTEDPRAALESLVGPVGRFEIDCAKTAQLALAARLVPEPVDSNRVPAVPEQDEPGATEADYDDLIGSYGKGIGQEHMHEYLRSIVRAHGHRWDADDYCRHMPVSPLARGGMSPSATCDIIT